MLDKKENMNLETYGGYIAKVIFNNGQSIEINKNDIVIFVGPNNVGKSQALKDLYALCKKKEAPIVVGDIEIVKYDTKPDKLLKTMSVITDHGTYQKYSGFGYDLGSYDIDRYKSDKYYGELRSVFVAYLNTLNSYSFDYGTGNGSSNGIETKSADKVPISADKMPINNLTAQQNTIFQFAKEKGKITSRQAEELLEVKQRRARSILGELVNMGILERKGMYKSTVYVLKDGKKNGNG